MKWKKLGKIFSPEEHSLSNGCKSFAQAPQTLVFDNFIRVYFSTRRRDESNGKYLSFISYVDFSKSFNQIIKVSNHTIIELGNLGCYDEHGIFPLNILRDDNQILGYIGGWNRRVSVSVDGAIGIAISRDNGETFVRIADGPILSSSYHEPFLIADPFVLKSKNIFHMWYIFGNKWIKENVGDVPERVYKIAYANSTDGINWQRGGKYIIAEKISGFECQALPTVIKINNRHHMYFCHRHAIDFRNDKSNSYKLGYAYSDDLINWIRNDENCGIETSDAGWDSDMVCYPHVFECDGKVYMLYNGNEFGKYGFGLAEMVN